MKQLTKAEEEVMQWLWQLEEANVASIIEQMPEPKPAYNTISTIIRILENKKFVSHRKKGKGYIYFPLVKKEEYSNQSLNKLMNNYFNGSFRNMVSFFVKKNDMDIKDLEQILKELDKEK
ncbi:putative transcriptional regulator [Aquimarina sp. EL_43]|uniref:BlaI/MecI/CopY family transcriptional regulator n=1 Tax=Aquimarina TaxID=290174 RepID=UPI0004720D76|nr:MULTISPECIES: BlaI/MecI/CopY family transcriptional regulator [Aquimarina]MBG6130491.1 putative transcriptional regulator [Aquimarina sp. EL_35]MBG6149271.1 putative transcriptional regulator [Aquimarina sp. EL_32]MBG6168355.1 putative transcriptional regulator [Aquimarina sp. EL_43]